MKEELLVKFTDKLLQYAQSAEIFASKNVPLYVEELLKFEFAKGIIWIVVIMVLILATVYIIKKAVDSDDEDAFIPATIFGGTFIIVLLIVATINTVKVAKIQVAPRVYIIDYLRSK